jgi:integrase
MPRRAPREFGKIRKLPSGRYQASYLTPAGDRRNASETFLTRKDADGWLGKQQTALEGDTWRDPEIGKITFETYARTWLAERDLKPRTREDYQRILDRLLIPAFGTAPLAIISPAAVRTWYARLDKSTPTMRAHTYGLLRTVMRAAVTEDIITASPCRVPGAGAVKRKVSITPASLGELEVIVGEMPERLQMIVVLAAWLGLRFGELAELRRTDIDLERQQVKVRRGVVRVKGGRIVDTPKTEAGIRTVAIPPHLIGPLKAHLRDHVEHGPAALLFPGELGGHLSPASLYDHYYPARTAAGRPDLRFHDLRHTGATLAAATGATLAELMHRLGHSTPQAAMRYQHAAADRDKAIAAALSQFHKAGVVQLRPRRGTGTGTTSP